MGSLRYDTGGQRIILKSNCDVKKEHETGEFNLYG